MTKRKYLLWFMSLLVLNLSIRLVIFYNTELFSFSDFRHHLDAIEKIAAGENVPLISGNYLFVISYIGYFFKYIAGNLDYFFWMNCFLGTAASGIVSLIVLKTTFNKNASLITLFLLSIYTEFLVFSSLFYTVILMIFILSLLSLLFFEYYISAKRNVRLIYLFFILIVVYISFLFKQELLFLPLFIFLAIIVFRKDTEFVRKTAELAITTLLATVLFYGSGLTNKAENKLANDFIFFGHTDYGGDGGEGSLIYPENKERYNEAWKAYLDKNSISAPTITDRNRFQAGEIKKYITHHPGRWVKLQFTKFFRTFGVVPEGISFRILYSGLLKGKLWLTSFVIVIPVAALILLFILLFDIQALRNLYYNEKTDITDNRLSERSGDPASAEPITDHRSPITERRTPNTHFLKIYLILFIYYLLATCFFGHYQERYRIPIMVVFIIPAISYYIATFKKKQFLNWHSLLMKAAFIVFILTIWALQAKDAMNNFERINKVIEKSIIQ